MVVTTKFIVVRSEDLAAVGRNESGSIYLVFKSGTTHNILYESKGEMTEDYLKLFRALNDTDSNKSEND